MKKKINIQEANKAIAKFMGGRVVRTEEYEMPHGSHSTGIIETWEFDTYSKSRDEYARIGHFKYDRDWNELMEVVEKIESLGFIVSNDQADTTILKPSIILGTEGLHSFIKCFGTSKKMTKKESIYQAIVEFVEWYQNKDIKDEKAD